jgi:hypothetical protein
MHNTYALFTIYQHSEEIGIIVKKGHERIPGIHLRLRNISFSSFSLAISSSSAALTE